MSSSESSSEGIILIEGFRNTSLLAILRSKDKSNDGNKSKFESIAKSNVIDTKAPKATVPPKLEIVNTENPKNKTIEV